MKSLVAALLVGAAGALLWSSLGVATPRGGSPVAGSSAVSKQSKPVAPEAAPSISGNAAPPVNAGQTASALAAEVEQALRDGSSAKRDHALYVLLPQLVACDPGVASRLALTWEAGSIREELLRRVMRSWVAKDTQGALRWLTSLPDPADRNLTAADTVEYLAQNDPASAIELSLVLGLGTRDGSLEHKAQLWAEEKPDEAVAWVVAQPASPERDQLLARIASVRAQQDPIDAGRLVLNQMAPGVARDDAIISVVHQWAVRDPAGAAAWVAQFQPGPLQARALTELETAAKQAPKPSAPRN